MTKINEQEIERRLRTFASVERSLVSQEFFRANAGCPPISRIPGAAEDGWPPDFRDHVSGGCLRCRKQIALQWNLVPPSLGSIVRHVIDGTAPEEDQIRQCVDNAGQAARTNAALRILTPLTRQVQKFTSLISSAQPALLAPAGAVFAPASEEVKESAPIHYVHDGLRWTAPIEAGKQYVYIEGTEPSDVLILTASSAQSATPAQPMTERVSLSPLTLRGTQFTWRASTCLGKVAELTKNYGRDYETTVVSLPAGE